MADQASATGIMIFYLKQELFLDGKIFFSFGDDNSFTNTSLDN